MVEKGSDYTEIFCMIVVEQSRMMKEDTKRVRDYIPFRTVKYRRYNAAETDFFNTSSVGLSCSEATPKWSRIN